MKRVEELLSEFATPNVVFQRKITAGKFDVTVVFHPDLTDAFVMRALVEYTVKSNLKTPDIHLLLKSLLDVSEAEFEADYKKSTARILSGDAALFLEGAEGCLIVNARKWDKRAVAEPPTETVMHGPREGFIEDLKTNLSLLERRLKTPALAIEKLQIGRSSSSTVALVYIGNIVAPELVNTVRAKLNKIDIDAVIDSYYLQPYLEEHPLSIFPQAGFAEKPDIVAAKLLEGRVAVILDGSPIVLTLPFMLVEDFHSSEDYYERSTFASFLRIMRFISVLFAVFLPGLYVSLQVYHYEIVPVKFLITLLNAIKGIPFPPLIEVLFVILLFEIIREAAVRMPRSVGMAMSIVGALVLGDTAVKAGIISSPSVMIIALSSIALYTVPNQVGPMSLLRILFTLIGGLGGLFGLVLGVIFLVHYLCSLDSLGTPYLSPFAPLLPNDLKDSLIKAPNRRMKTRPDSVPNINSTRQG